MSNNEIVSRLAEYVTSDSSDLILAQKCSKDIDIQLIRCPASRAICVLDCSSALTLSEVYARLFSTIGMTHRPCS